MMQRTLEGLSFDMPQQPVRLQNWRMYTVKTG